MSIAIALAVLLALGWVFLRESPSSPATPKPLPPPPDPTSLPGGTPEYALEVASPAVIESAASQDPCLGCGARLHCEHHRVEIHGGERYRVADLKCPRCGYERAIYFVLRSGDAPPLLN